MSFLRSRAEQLADYLRGCISRGELFEPLPPTREWSERLGVSRPTLRRALTELQREGLLAIRPRGIHLSQSVSRNDKAASQCKLVRLLYPGRDFPEIHHCIGWISLLSERLHLHGIDLVVERCMEDRFNSILREPRRPNELLILLGVSVRHQKQFARSGKPTLVCGEPPDDLRLPFITDDQDGAVRHATWALLRKGFPGVTLIIAHARSPGVARTLATFRDACAQWRHQPVESEVHQVSLNRAALGAFVRRFAARFRHRRGIIVVSPVPVSLVTTALLQRGVSMPPQAEVAAILHPSTVLQLLPPPIHYAADESRLVKDLAQAVGHFFETGSLPIVQKRNPVEITSFPD